MPIVERASQAYELLAAEIDRVVNSPYPTQLKVGLQCTNWAPASTILLQIHGD